MTLVNNWVKEWKYDRPTKFYIENTKSSVKQLFKKKEQGTTVRESIKFTM